MLLNPNNHGFHNTFDYNHYVYYSDGLVCTVPVTVLVLTFYVTFVH